MSSLGWSWLRPGTLVNFKILNVNNFTFYIQYFTFLKSPSPDNPEYYFAPNLSATLFQFTTFQNAAR